jgi:hypothetical protein
MILYIVSNSLSNNGPIKPGVSSVNFASTSILCHVRFKECYFCVLVVVMLIFNTLIKLKPSVFMKREPNFFTLPISSLKLMVLSGLMMMGFAASSQTYGDYTLYSAQNSNKAYLLNMAGSVYHTWTFASSQKTSYSTYMEPGGTLVRTVSGISSVFTGPISSAVQKVDWNGNVVWHYAHSSSTYCLHHDICPMPNGNVLMIAYELKTQSEVAQAGCTLNISMWSEKIIEVMPTGPTSGDIVWEWHLWDHLCQDVNAAKDNYVSSIVNNPQRININYTPQKDWMHMNGVDYNPVLDQVTFSSHNLNEIYVIDHSTTTTEAAGHTGGNSGKGGDILYRWGNPAAYGATGTRIFNVVHDAHWVPYDCPNGGYLSGFNNKGGTGNKTCVDLINPPLNGYLYNQTPGSAFSPSTYNWRHTYSGSATSNMGSAQQLPNGNTLICIAMWGYIYEIDSNQTVVWSKSIGGAIAKAYRYTAAWVNGTLDAGGPAIDKFTWILYPNPSSGVFYANGLEEGTVAEVIDIQGKVITAVVLAGKLDLVGLRRGVYMIRIPRKPEAGVIKVVIGL